MRQRVRLAAVQALDHDLYVLDEPTTGTDPVIRAELIEWVRGLGEAGRTVLVASHVLSEVQQMTERIVLMLGGRIRAAGELREIRELLESSDRRLVIRCRRPRALAPVLAAQDGVSAVGLSRDDTLEVETSRGAWLGEHLPRLAADCGAGLEEVVAPDESLAGLFRVVTRRRRARP
jgi:ABC-2 type transport system ATP-binding protein